jgi:DNA-binding transcriptional LysR family regulator
MPADIHPRLLRGFVATAEELHFGRAAQRLRVAQQALSRDVRTLERVLGQTLFERSTRQVALTPAGSRLLPRARRLLALHDDLLADGTARPLLVDLNSAVTGPDLTPDRLLEAARSRLPEAELLARFHGGLAGAAAALLAHRLDVAFGWFAGLSAPLRRQLTHRPIRLEPMALILPLEHPLAGWDAVPVAGLRRYRLDVCAGNEATTEWTELGSRLARAFGVPVAPPRSPAVGPEEFGRYLLRHGDPALTTTGMDDIPGTVTRPLVDPVPLSPVSLVHRPDLRHPGLDALLQAAAELGSAEGWLERPADSWLP